MIMISKELPPLPPRTILIPDACMQQFLHACHANTLANLESCALLCGILHDPSTYLITTLLFPYQRVTTDSCTMEREQDIAAYVTSTELIVLGWIHTHPTQECFLSSIDMHTQAAYQIDLGEAVSVVVSPRHEPWFGVFQLSREGLQVVRSCKDDSGFHGHAISDSEMVRDVTHHGHVRFCETEIEVVDLRHLIHV
jgi:STAM-binding protein